MGEKRNAYRILYENLEEGCREENLDVLGMKILKQILEKCGGNYGLNHQAKDGGRWRVLVGTVTNLRDQ
jgi:hypothetical protein